MRLFVFDPPTRRAVLEALVMMDERARRIALESATFVGVGLASAGVTLPPDEARGWLVCVGERDGARDSILHECAHVACGHVHGGVEAERQAATLAARWGATGDSADPNLAVRLVREFVSNAPEMRAVTDRDGSVRVECRCGATCKTYSPRVGGRVAEIGIECSTCAWVAVEPVQELVRCPDCRARAAVTWSERATPTSPEVRLVCPCGTNLSLRLQREPDAEPERPRRPPVPEEMLHADWAARRLVEVEESLRRLEPAMQAGEKAHHTDALESLRSVIVWTRGLLLRATRGLDASDARLPILRDADAEVARAGERLKVRDLSAAADAVANATRILDVLLAPAEGRRA